MISALRRLPRVETAVLVVAFAMLVAVGVIRARTQTAAAPLDSYSTYDADAGGYRALYELIAREAGPVARFERRPAFLDSEIATLVYAEPLPFDPRQLANTAADVAALERWVRDGGRLVYLGHDDEAAKRGTLGTPATRPARGHGARASTPYVAPELAAAGVASVESAAPLRYREKRGARVLLADGRGPLVLAYPFGRGSVVAIVDESLFTNAGLATADRARLAAALVTRPAAGTLAFDESAHGHVIPEHWWQIVPPRFTIALGIGALAAAIALVGAALRLGPPLVPEPRDDRTSGDFARAAASLLQRARGRERALLGAFEQTSRIAARAAGLADDVGTHLLAEHVEPAAARADFERLAELTRRVPLRDADFVRGIALAQRLRTEMTGHARARR